MGRQVVRGTELRGGTVPTEEQGDIYVNRLLKLIPSETVALYMFLYGIIKSALSSPDQLVELQIWQWVTFAAVIVLNLFYLKKFHDVRDPVQYTILTIAFVIWVLTIGGPFENLNFYKPFIGSLLLGLFTFSIPIFYKGISIS